MLVNNMVREGQQREQGKEVGDVALVVCSLLLSFYLQIAAFRVVQ